MGSTRTWLFVSHFVGYDKLDFRLLASYPQFWCFSSHFLDGHLSICMATLLQPLKELIEQQAAEHVSKLEAHQSDWGGNHQATWGQVELGRFSNLDIMGICTNRKWLKKVSFGARNELTRVLAPMPPSQVFFSSHYIPWQFLKFIGGCFILGLVTMFDSEICTCWLVMTQHTQQTIRREEKLAASIRKIYNDRIPDLDQVWTSMHAGLQSQWFTRHLRFSLKIPFFSATYNILYRTRYKPHHTCCMEGTHPKVNWKN